MRKRAIVLFLMMASLLHPFTALSQENVKNMAQELTRTRNNVDKLERRLNEANYTRIPNKDFDEILERKVSKAVETKLRSWVLPISLIAGLLGSALIYAARAYLNTQIDRRYDEKAKDIIRQKADAEKLICRLELEAIKKEPGYTTNPDKFLGKLYLLLQRCEEIGHEDLIPLTIDEIIFLNFLRLDSAQIIKLIDELRVDYRVSSPSLVNGAYVCMENYVVLGGEILRTKAMEYLDLALEQLPGYGEAYGLKLMLYMIDLHRCESDKAREEAKKECGNVFRAINGADSDIPAYETEARLEKYRGFPAYSKFLGDLETLFPDELGEMKEKAQKYREFQKGYSSDEVQELS